MHLRRAGPIQLEPEFDVLILAFIGQQTGQGEAKLEEGHAAHDGWGSLSLRRRIIETAEAAQD